jgi:prophage regulatory protein
MTEHRLLRLDDVMSRTGLARSTIYQMMAEGRFPPAIKIAPRAVAWIAAEVDQHIERLITAARSDPSQKGCVDGKGS